MRILHTADWHLGKTLYDFTLLEDQRHMIDGLLKLLHTGSIDAIVIAGDVYDRPVPSAQAVQLYDYFLSEAVGHMGIPVLAIAGNHDSSSRLEFGSSLYASSGYHVCGHVHADLRRVTLSDAYGPVDFWLIPYLHPADVRALYPGEEIRTYDDAYRVLLEHNLPRIDLTRRNLAVAHGFFSSLGGSQDKPLLTSDSEVTVGGMDLADSSCFSAFDYTALGHLHASQSTGNERIRYSGSPLKYSLSEERHQKSFTQVELGKKGTCLITPLPVSPLRDVRSIRGTLEQLLEPSFYINSDFDDYVFADLEDSGVLYPMEKLRKLFPHLLGLRIIGAGDGLMPEVKVGGSMPRLSPEQMFRRFYREVRGTELTGDALAFLREALAAEMEVDS